MTLRSHLPAFALVAGLVCFVPSASFGADAVEPAKPAADAEGNAADFMSSVPSELRNCEFERHAEFMAAYKSRLVALKAELENLQAKDAESTTTARLRQARAELTAARLGFEEKLLDAGDATVETWYAARDNVAASWDTLRAAFSRANEVG